MVELRAEERWAAACVQAALPGVTVGQHDDNTLPGMYDLDLSLGDCRTFGAMEVTAAIDGTLLEGWKLLPGREERWTVPGLNGGWHIVVGRDARLKGPPQELCRLLQILERDARTRPGPEVRDGLTKLGVVYARQGDTDYRGSVYVTLEIPPDRSSGVVASTGDALSEWVSGWMRDPSRSDNLAKLGRSGAPERHLFVIVPGVVTTAPFPVTNLLMRPDAPLPTVSPSLPPEVTHVWIMSTWAAGHGFRWSPERGWQTFATDVVPDPSPVGGCTCR